VTRAAATEASEATETPPTIFVLGLLAQAGHGKTTVARHLAAAHGARVRSLAGPMKRAMQRVFGLSDAQVWGTQEDKEAVDPRYGFSPRWLLQRMGTEGLRAEFGSDVHHRALARVLREEAATHAAAEATTPLPLFVIDDVRFPDDAAFIAGLASRAGPEFRGAVMKIVASDVPRGESSGHASERAIDEVRDEHVAATVVSSRAQGPGHLLAQVTEALRTSPGLAVLRPALALPGVHADGRDAV